MGYWDMKSVFEKDYYKWENSVVPIVMDVQ